MTELTRTALLSRALVAGGAIATGGLVAAHVARAADSDEDLAWVRLGVNLEFLKTVFSTRARRSGFFTGADAGSLKRGQEADQTHLDKFVETLTSQGRTSIDGHDLDIVFPTTAFNTRGNIAALGSRLAILGVRSYLGASGTVASPTLRILFAQVAANEGEQMSFFQGLRGHAIGRAFPNGYDIARAADELAVYLP
jgi:Ferritin-like domain